MRTEGWTILIFKRYYFLYMHYKPEYLNTLIKCFCKLIAWLKTHRNNKLLFTWNIELWIVVFQILIRLAGVYNGHKNASKRRKPMIHTFWNDANADGYSTDQDTSCRKTSEISNLICLEIFQNYENCFSSMTLHLV